MIFGQTDKRTGRTDYYNYIRTNRQTDRTDRLLRLQNYNIHLKKMNVGRFALFPSKMAFFKREWQKVKVLSHPWAVGSKLPLIRPFKWGTLRRKSLLRRIYFLFFQLWRLVFLEPPRVRERNVPHLKGLISDKLEPTAQGRNSTFTFLHALLKKAILHHKTPKSPRLLHRTVYTPSPEACKSCILLW